MKRNVIHIVTMLSVTLLTTSSLVGRSQAQNKSTNFQSQQRVTVEAVASSAPANINSAMARMVDGQTVLHYGIVNRTGGQLTTFEVVAFILDKSGQVKGGEGWTVGNSLATNAAESFIRIMKTKVGAEDRLRLAVWQVSGEAGLFKVNEAELPGLLHPRASAERRAVNVRPVKLVSEAGEYCLDRLKAAEASCKCGVKSFSCNPSNGEWSFGSYTKAESPDGCKTEAM